MVLTSRRNSSTARDRAAEFKRQISHPVLISPQELLPVDRNCSTGRVTSIATTPTPSRSIGSNCSTTRSRSFSTGAKHQVAVAPGQLFELRGTAAPVRSSTCVVGHHRRHASSANNTDDDSRPSSPDSAIWTDMSSPDLSFSRQREEDMQTPTGGLSSRAQKLRDMFASTPRIPRTPTPASSGQRAGKHLHRSNPNIHRIDTASSTSDRSDTLRSSSSSQHRLSATSCRLGRVSSFHQLRRNAVSTGNVQSTEVHFQCWLARQPHTWC